MRTAHTIALAMILAAIGIGTAAWKHVSFGFPLQPNPETEVWTVEARARLHTTGGPVRVEMPIPGQPDGFTIIEEGFISSTFGAVPGGDGRSRHVVWSAREPGANPVLYYRMQLAQGPERSEPPEVPAPSYLEPPEYDESLGTAIASLLEEVRRKSADAGSFARQLVQQYAHESDDRIQMLRYRAQTPEEHVKQLISILAGARIPARTVWTLELADGLRRGHLDPWLQVYTGVRWRTINPDTGQVGLPINRLVWTVDDGPGLRVHGGRLDEWQVAATRTQRDVLTVAQQRAAEAGSRVMDFSLTQLPVQTQNLYRLLVVLPVGALLVVLMRNVVGVQTFGTFMPVLIAFAFRETQLWLGILLFCATVALALGIRFYLERLRLLLVPRLASMLTVIVLVMAAISLFSHHMGLERALSVGLFPIIVLAMTVERMSIVWEEVGPPEALAQGAGSLLVAVLAYGVMTQPLLQHVLFVFPELLLVVLALSLGFGRYTGYRLSEVWRFRGLLRRGSFA